MIDDIILQSKLLLKIENEESEQLLSFYSNLIVDEVKNYCNIEEIPSNLKNIIISMVMEYYNKKHSTSDVSSVKRGDTLITYKTDNNIIFKDFIKDYYSQLNQFRKLRVLK